MIRVLYCTDFLMSGGVERQLTELVMRLDRTRFAPQVICLYGPKAGRSLHFLSHLETAKTPVRMLDLGWGAKDKLRGWQAIAWWTWQIRPAIVHAVNYHSNLLSRLARPFMPPRTRLIGAVRTEYTPKQLRYERLSWWLCAAMVCNSPHLQRQLTDQARVPARRVHLIPNGVDTERFAKNLRPELRGQLAPGARRVFVMPGRITRQKSPQLLARALGLLRERDELPADLRVMLVGEGEDAAVQAELNAAIQGHRLTDVLSQHEQTPQPETFYHAADVTVLPSLWEGMPNVALESLAAGHPVIISEAANAAQIVIHNETGWVVKTGDVEHLAETLKRVACLSTEELQAMQQACLRRAADFSMQRMVASYEHLYERLTAMPKP